MHILKTISTTAEINYFASTFFLESYQQCVLATAQLHMTESKHML